MSAEGGAQSNHNRRTYLVTYSQADLSKFPTRKSFAEAVATAFSKGSGKVTVDYYACCLEPHEKNSGYHYHVTIKLSGPKRWNPVRRELLELHHINVNFSEEAENYYAGYKYICKLDQNVYESPNHPNLKEIGSPRTKLCMQAYRNKCKQVKLKMSSEEEKVPPKIRRLSNLDVSEYLVANTIKSETELFAHAKQQKEAGKKELANFVMSRSAKALQDIITQTWRMNNATENIDRNNKTRLELLRQFANGECVEDCNGIWLECSIEVLTNNRINPVVFSAAMRDLLEKGRGKFRNIMIVGPANCAKTFILAPLTMIYNTFTNPSNDKYAWIGAEKAEVIFLNDFRWSPDMIAWKELLLLLEGQTVHLPAPKNHYSSDISIDAQTPIFATGKSMIKYVGKYNTQDPIEDEMMSVRWRTFEFFRQIRQHEQLDIQPCAKCFASLVFMSDL